MNDGPGWKNFEKAVEQIESLFSPHATITRNAQIEDHIEHIREFDVSISDNWGGRQILAVIECKDWNRRVGPQTIDAFNTKKDDVRANLAAIVSKKGFTSSALTLARHYNIGTLSLLPEDKEISGFALGWPAYAEIWLWKDIGMSVVANKYTQPPATANVFNIYYDDKNVIGWFLRKLNREYKEYKKEGLFELQVSFQRPRILNIEGSEYEIRTVYFTAIREKMKKYKYLVVTGDAYYDWQEDKIKLPNKGQVVSESFNINDLFNWEDYEGEMPTAEEVESDIVLRFRFFASPP